MLSPGQPAGMSKEEAIKLREELQRCRSRGRQLLGALEEVAATVDRALRALLTPGQAPRTALNNPSGGARDFEARSSY
ncbi:MAG TPA: hypothetical protein VG455_07935 [Acidimicrobiales bacterium]|nr:hypothetical protein [Acidimicrobiales bacterium]